MTKKGKCSTFGILDRLTEPLEEAEADRGAGEDEEGEVDVITALVPDDQPTAAGDPGQRTVDDPSMPAEALAALDPAPGDPGDDAPLPAGAAAAGVIVRLIGVQLLRSPPGPAARLADRRHGVERLLEHDAVVDVGGREQDRQRDALPVHDEVALAARLAAVGRVRPGRGPAGLGGQARRVERAPAPVDQPGLAEPVERRVVDPRPAAALLPVPEPSPAGHAGAAAHLLREHLPGDAALQHEQDAGQSGAVLDRRAAALRTWRARREERSEQGPEGVGNQGCSHAPTGGEPMPLLLPREGSVRPSKHPSISFIAASKTQSACS